MAFEKYGKYVISSYGQQWMECRYHNSFIDAPFGHKERVYIRFFHPWVG